MAKSPKSKGADSPGAGSEKPETVIGLRAFARLEEVNVSLASIQEAISSGRITAVKHTKHGRKLYKERALEEWNATRVAGRNNRFGELPADGRSKGGTFLDENGIPWNVRKVQEDALLAAERRAKIELERAEHEGKLHRDEDVEHVWADILVRFRTRILALPAAASPLIAALPKATPDRVQEILTELIHDALTELSQYDQAKIKAERRKRIARRG